MSNLSTKLQYFPTFTYIYDVIFLGASMQNRGSYESKWHSKCDESFRESIGQLLRKRWAKNRISGQKIENRL